MKKTEDLVCPICKSTTFSTQLVKNETRRNRIQFIITIIALLLPMILLLYSNKDGNIKGAAFLGLFIGVLFATVASKLCKLIFKFIPDEYTTIFICENCGKQIRK